MNYKETFYGERFYSYTLLACRYETEWHVRAFVASRVYLVRLSPIGNVVSFRSTWFRSTGRFPTRVQVRPVRPP